jgi:hypothetical protein
MRKDLRIWAVACFVLGGAFLGCSSKGSSPTPEAPRGGPTVDDDDVGRERNITAAEPVDARLRTWQATTELDNQTTALAVGGTSTDQWINIGPSPQVLTSGGHTTYHAGRVAGVAVHPTNTSIWLVAADRGGIWKTSDAGTTWTPTTDDQVTLHSQAIAFAKSNPTIVYANNGGGGSGGLLKSTDTGSTWVLKATYPFNAGNATRIRVSPTDPNVVLASIESDRDSGATGIWKSTDGGVTFPTRKLVGLAGTDLDYNPNDFNQQIGAIGNDAHGVYISRDAGETWTSVGHGTATWEKSGRAVNQVKVAIAPSNVNIAYAGFDYSDDGTHHLWKTTNIWASPPTWTEVAATTEGFLGLLVDPTNTGIVYHLGNGLFRVNGSTITHIDNLDTQPVDALIHIDQRGAAWAGTRLVVGNDGGVYSTTNPTATTVTWTNHNTNAQGGATRLSIAQFWDGSLHPTNPNVALGGVLDDGSAKWTGTSDWREVLDADGFDNFFSSSAPDTMYACSFQGLGISRTKDDAVSPWVRPDLPDIPTDYRPFVSKFERCPSNENVVAAGTDGIWLTTNFFSSAGAASWQQKVTVPSTSPDFHNDVFAITFAASDTTCKTFAYGGTNGRLFITKDQGTTWTNLDPSNQVPDLAARFPLASVTRLAFDPNNANVLYVALGGYDVDRPSTPGHLFKTTTALAASPMWVNVTPPSPAGDAPYNAVVVDPYDSKIVYVGTDLGIWRNTDAATTTNWTHYGIAAGMPFVQVMDLEYQKSTDRLVAFSFGRGAFLFQPAIANAPTLSGTAGTQQAQLSWTASLGARTYNLKRSQTTGGPYTLVRNQATTSFTDTGLAAGSYFYIVTSVNTTGESVNSNELSITIGSGGDPDRTEGGTATGTGTACNTTLETVAMAYDNLMSPGTQGTNWTKWCITSAPSTTTPISTMYDFSGATAFAITRYTITTANDDATRDPRDWTLQGCQGTCTAGSDTGWTTLDTRTNQFPAGNTRLATTSFSFTNTTAYQQYRLRITANRGNTTRTQLAEIQMFGGACAPTTCAAQGKNCGSIADGCGGNLNCGTCTAPQTCGGGGTANVCGGGGGTACAPAYNVSNCNTYLTGTQVSNTGHNWTCSNGNCANCAVDTRCAPGGTGCPWGVVWTDNGACQ